MRAINWISDYSFKTSLITVYLRTAAVTSGKYLLTFDNHVQSRNLSAICRSFVAVYDL